MATSLVGLAQGAAREATGPTSRIHTMPRARAIEAILLAGLVVCALALRLPYLWTIPMFTDESREVLQAVQILRGEESGLVNVDAYIGSLFNWLLAVGFFVGGPSPYLPRLLTATAGALTAVPAYLLARDIGGARAGMVAAALVATSGSLILSNGHIAWSHCLTPLFTTCGAWLLHRAVERRARTALLGAGVAFGLALQTHPATLVLLPGAVAYMLWRGRFWLRTPWPYLAMALFLLANANLLAYNLATGWESIRNAAEIRERYARGRDALIGPLTYLANHVTHDQMLVRYLAGAVDARSSYLTDPSLWIAAGLSIIGLASCARSGGSVPLVLAASAYLVMPYFNERKYVPVSDGRYLMPTLPLAFIGIGVLAEFIRARTASTVAARVGWIAAVAIAVLYPLAPLGRYFSQEMAAGRTNTGLFETLQTVKTNQRPDEPVLLDADLRDVRMEGGGTAFRSLRFLLTTTGITDRSVDNVGDYLRRLPNGNTALLVQEPVGFGRTAAELARSDPFGEPGISGAALSTPLTPRAYGVTRVERTGDAAATRQTPQAATRPVSGPVPLEVVASGLVNPRGLLFRPDGSLLVAEAGNGGQRLVDVGREKPQPAGRSGQITRFSAGLDRSIVARDLPSIVTAVGEEVGPSALALLDDKLFVLEASGGWDIGDPDFNSGIFQVREDGRLDRLFDFSIYTVENPTRARIEDPKADVPRGMPYGMAALNGRLYVTDGNQEQIVEVAADGRARRIVEYPRSNRALTGIAAGPDGALYVAEFAASKVTRVTIEGDVSDAATKVRTPIGVTFDAAGSMYVLEYSGRVLRAAPVGQEQKDVLADGLREPTAIAYGPDGNLYVSVLGHHSGRGEGQIVRLRLVPAAPMSAAQRIALIIPYVVGMMLFVALLAIGFRFRRGRDNQLGPAGSGDNSR